MNNLTSTQALDLIRARPENYQPPESLRSLLNQVDMHISGEITIFYSGSYDTGNGSSIYANDIVQTMYKNGDNIRIINNTEMANLLDNKEFQTATAKAYGITNPLIAERDYNDQSSRLNAAFYDAENGLCADASRRFASETVGEVRTLTAFASQ